MAIDMPQTDCFWYWVGSTTYSWMPSQSTLNWVESSHTFPYPITLHIDSFRSEEIMTWPHWGYSCCCLWICVSSSSSDISENLFVATQTVSSTTYFYSREQHQQLVCHVNPADHSNSTWSIFINAFGRPFWPDLLGNHYGGCDMNSRSGTFILATYIQSVESFGLPPGACLTIKNAPENLSLY